MSKMMTGYLVLNAIGAHRLAWDSIYSPSDYVLSISEQPSIVNLGMEVDGQYTVGELFKSMSIASANDAALALTEMVARTEERFVNLMNEHAAYFGLNETIYYNASGLDGENIGQGQGRINVSSARDVAFLARKLILAHPEVLAITSMPNFQTSAGAIQVNTNLMVSGLPHAMAGIDGLKTGYTDEAGPCFVSTGVFGGRRIVTVVIGVEAVNGDTINPRFELTKKLIERFAF